MSPSNLGFGRKLGFGIASILIAVAAMNVTLFSILKTGDQACQPQDQLIGLARLISAGGGLSTILLVLLVGWWFLRDLVRPMAELTDVMKKLADGDVGIAVPFAGRKDEAGHMAAAVEFFKDQAVKRLKKKAEEAEAMKVWQQEDEAISSALGRLAEGDLVYRIGTAFTTNSEKTRNDFNRAVEKLQEMVRSVRARTRAIQAGTAEISFAADELSQRTEQQASAFEEATVSLEQITQTVKSTAQGAMHAHEVVSSAKLDADASGQVVRQAIAAMGEIETSSRQIGQIIGVVDEIAFQTNLLALNAGVEAARAGDAGRGFAVVASEVRSLAQRSAEAAKEIKGLISTSTTQVSKGVDLVDATGKALSRIFEKVAELDSVVSTIARGAQEEATALQQVNIASNEMDRITQQNTAMVEETTAATHVLRQESEELVRAISCFNIGPERESDGVAFGRKAGRPASAPQTAPRKGVVSRGGALRKPEPTLAENSQKESWEEF